MAFLGHSRFKLSIRKPGISIPMLVVGLLVTFSYLVFRCSQVPEQRLEIPQKPLVQTNLLANTDAIVPGKEFILGVHFKIATGWHIYWKDPGDSGLPTTVELRLPDGFVSGPLLYPQPLSFIQPGDILGYGYKDEVMLLAKIYPPADLIPGSKRMLQAHARWLSCREQCVLGEKQLEYPLPVAQEARAIQNRLFQKWVDRLPQKPETASVTGSFPNER